MGAKQDDADIREDCLCFIHSQAAVGCRWHLERRDKPSGKDAGGNLAMHVAAIRLTVGHARVSTVS
jgi:hypothetical protein